MGKRELIALLNLSSWCLVMVERLFLAVPRGCLQFVIVVFPDHTHLLFWKMGHLSWNGPGNALENEDWSWKIIKTITALLLIYGMCKNMSLKGWICES